MKLTVSALWIFGICALLTACDQGKDSPAVMAANKRMDAADMRVKGLETRLNELEQSLKQQNSGQWILWSRFQAKSNMYMVGYAPPQPVSAFQTKEDCAQSSEIRIASGGKKVSVDPVQIEYENGTQYFFCLPRGVDAGFKTVK